MVIEVRPLQCLCAIERLADLFLVVLDGQLEAAEVHALLQQAPLVHVILAGRVVEDHFQLPGIPSLRQQVLGEHLALLGQLLVVVPGAEEQIQISRSLSAPESGVKGDEGRKRKFHAFTVRLRGRSYLNSTSTRLSSRRSTLSSKALRIGSSSVSMIRDGLARQR